MELDPSPPALVPSTGVPSTGGLTPPEATVRVCLVSLGGESFAIALENVREIFEVESFTRVAKMPLTFAGVASVRGVIVPLVDLRPLLGLPVQAPDPAFAVVVRHRGHQVGVLVEQLPEIRTVSKEEMQGVQTAGLRANRPFISSLLRIENRVSGVVEVPSLLACVNR